MSMPVSLAAACAGSYPLTIGLTASTDRPICLNWRISEATTWVLPTSVPVAVMKIAVTISLPRRYESAERQAIPAKTEKNAALATGYTIGESIA
jgi:hypothetical protein